MNSEDIETLRNRVLQGYEDDIKAEAMVISSVVEKFIIIL